MRLTPEDALRLGLCDSASAAKISKSSRGDLVLGSAVAKLNEEKLKALSAAPISPAPGGPKRAQLKANNAQQSKTSGLPAPGSKEYRELETSPQKILYDALCQRLPRRVQWEVPDLIPGRRFQADIFIPPVLVVEMDGFRFHRTKESFQNDRDRQNLFVANGFRPIRAYAKQIFDLEMRAELIELIVKAAELTCACISETPHRL
jgi:very-short-patch-repair endonuclease